MSASAAPAAQASSAGAECSTRQIELLRRIEQLQARFDKINEQLLGHKQQQNQQQEAGSSQSDGAASFASAPSDKPKKEKDPKPSKPAAASSSKSAPSPSPSPSPASSLPSDDDPSQWWLQPSDELGVSGRLTALCRQQLGLTKFRFLRVDESYYEWSLQKRRDTLGVPSVRHLCKSVVMENVRRDNGTAAAADQGASPSPDAAASPSPAPSSSASPLACVDEFDRVNPRYLLILVSYAAKLHKEKLARASVAWHQAECAARGGNVKPWLSKKDFNWRLAPEAVARAITGYEHNATTPFGLAESRLPILMAASILDLPTGSFALGGGEVATKLRISTREFVQAIKPHVADITVPDEELDRETEQ